MCTVGCTFSGKNAACKEAIDRGLAAEHAMDMLSDASRYVLSAGIVHVINMQHHFQGSQQSVTRFMSTPLQEVTRHLPNNAQYRSLLAKQWTDCTYLDLSPAKENLTDDSRRQFNTTAVEHAQQVGIVTYLHSCMQAVAILG